MVDALSCTVLYGGYVSAADTGAEAIIGLYGKSDVQPGALLYHYFSIPDFWRGPRDKLFVLYRHRFDIAQCTVANPTGTGT